MGMDRVVRFRRMMHADSSFQHRAVRTRRRIKSTIFYVTVPNMAILNL